MIEESGKLRIGGTAWRQILAASGLAAWVGLKVEVELRNCLVRSDVPLNNDTIDDGEVLWVKFCNVSTMLAHLLGDLVL
jgi:hypothetical protein